MTPCPRRLELVRLGLFLLVLGLLWYVAWRALLRPTAPRTGQARPPVEAPLDRSLQGPPRFLVQRI